MIYYLKREDSIMKKRFLALVVACFLTACSSGTVTKGAAVYKIEQQNAAVTMTFDAKGDEIVFFHQKTVMNTEGLSDEDVEGIKTLAKQAVSDIKHYKGAKYKINTTDDELIETIDVPINKDTLKADKDYQLLNIEGEADDGLSLSKTRDALKAAGWEKVK